MECLPSMLMFGIAAVVAAVTVASKVVTSSAPTATCTAVLPTNVGGPIRQHGSVYRLLEASSRRNNQRLGRLTGGASLEPTQRPPTVPGPRHKFVGYAAVSPAAAKASHRTCALRNFGHMAASRSTGPSDSDPDPHLLADVGRGTRLELIVTDPEVVAALSSKSSTEERNRFALQALRIGVLALSQTEAQVDALSIREEGRAIMAELKRRLEAHDDSLHAKVASLLATYFNPNDGRFAERIDRLVRKDGDLERLFRQQIGPSVDSELGRTLAASVGLSSPLMRRLSPDDAEGVVSTIGAELDKQLTEQRRIVLQQLSLDDGNSALSRFRREVVESQQRASGDLQAQVKEVVKEFSLDEEGSALSRLVHNVERAQATITREFSLDDDASSLSRLQRKLVGMLDEQREDNRRFQLEVSTVLAEMRASQTERSRNATEGGFAFEQRVVEAISDLCQAHGDVVAATGATTGRLRNCKVGDATVELGAESAAPGARVVFEVKQDRSYTLAAALEELEVAKRNRDAQVGVFVWSAQSAPDLDPVARYGSNIVVTWDGADSSNDLILRVALSLARALCVRRSAESLAGDVDLGELDRALSEVERQAGQLDQIATWAGTIRSNATKILDRVEKTKRNLMKELDRLRDVASAVKDAIGSQGETGE